MMTCEQMEAYINDFVETLLDSDTHAMVEAHLDKCDACRAEVAGLQALLEEVRNMPRSIEPSRDLWSGILDRIDAAPPENVVRFETLRRKIVPRALMAAAAVGVIFLGLVFSRVAMDRMNPQEAPVSVIAVGDAQKFEQEYLQARDELRSALEEKKADLSPEMLAVIEENLSIIEDAVVDIHRAIANNPNNEGLEQKLHAAYRTEVTLLRQAVQMEDDI